MGRNNIHGDEKKIIGGSFCLSCIDDSYFYFYYRNSSIDKGDKICWWEHVVTGEKIKIHIEKSNE